MKKTINRFIAYFKKRFSMCPSCNSFMSMKHSYYWIGGYNRLCEQACSREGERCYECGHMEWSKTDEEYEESLPEWCDAYSTK